MKTKKKRGGVHTMDTLGGMQQLTALNEVGNSRDVAGVSTTDVTDNRGGRGGDDLTLSKVRQRTPPALG